MDFSWGFRKCKVCHKNIRNGYEELNDNVDEKCENCEDEFYTPTSMDTVIDNSDLGNKRPAIVNIEHIKISGKEGVFRGKAKSSGIEVDEIMYTYEKVRDKKHITLLTVLKSSTQCKNRATHFYKKDEKYYCDQCVDDRI